MAKRRERPVENPLRRDLVASISGRAAVAVLPPKDEQGREQKPDRVGRPPRKWSAATVTMKTRFVEAEAKENAELARWLGKLVRRPGDRGARQVVTESHITRALWSLARRASDELEVLGSKAPKLKRPPHGDSIATAEFEDAIADFILAALKRTRRGE